MTTTWRRLAGGAAAGAAATVPMSAVMLAAGRLGLMGTQPPEAIADRALDEAGAHVFEPTIDVLAALAHLGFGAAAGAVFRLARPRGGPGSGLAWAALVYAGSYLGWVPALGILPPATKDREGRVGSMLAAHAVFGAVLGALPPRDHTAAPSAT